MVDLDILEELGSTQERMREIFEALPMPTPEERAMLSEEEVSKREHNWRLRDRFEADINRRFSEQINYALQNYQMYSAVDVAWDAPPINKETYPLLLYAQGKLDPGKCAKTLQNLPNVDKYTTKDSKGNIVAVNLPKFFEVNFNLVRSVITRRLAAQANKYMALYPNYKYEPRSTTLVGKLRADVLSQIMDIMTDQFNLRHHDLQVMRDSMLYAHCIDFIRSKWETEEQLAIDTDINPDLASEENPRFKNVITKEGVGWINPHPSRTFWDNAYPLSEINTDTGPKFVGFWDVVRYGDVADDPTFWNRKTISYSATIVQLFSTYAQYFSQYYCTIIPPCDISTLDLSSPNDRKNNLGLYAQSMKDSSMIIANYYRKIIPKDWGIGDYPYPVWLRLVIAGDKTVIYAEFLPSTPACYCGINENDSRQLNISIAMELLPYQDQMTQLLSLLLLTVQSSNIRILAINKDLANAEDVKRFREDMEAKSRYPAAFVFEYSKSKMEAALPGFDITSFIQLVQTQPSNAINEIFMAMSRLVELSERLMALSPHELGQPAPREISATETNMMAGTTETIYGFISDSFDEFRSAKKRILYESYIVCGSGNFRVPVINRYTRKTIAKAGFEVVDEDDEASLVKDPSEPQYHTITGTKQKLVYEYIFTSRDGALRAVNTQSANVLVQLLGILQNPVVMQKMGAEKIYEIVNEIFRLSGTSFDLNLELEEGETNNMGPDKQQQIEQMLGSLTQNAEQEHAIVQKLGAQVEQLVEMMKELTAKVQELENKPATVQVDPMKFLQGRQKMQQDEAFARQRMDEGRQKMRHAQEDHDVDLALKIMPPARENGGRSAYSR